MQVEGLPELAEESAIAHWRAAHRVSRWLTRPAPARLERTPAELGLPWQALDCRTGDGLRLAGWVVEPHRPRATLLLFHDLHQNRQQTLEWTATLAGQGCRCVAFDHRAHGESEGWRTSFGWWEREDVLAVRALAGRRWPGRSCAAIGWGLGAAALCFAGSASRLDALVLLGLNENLAKLFAEAARTFPAPLQDFWRRVMRVTERRLGVQREQLAPLPRLRSLRVPSLLLPDSGDVQAAAEFLRRRL